MKSRAAHPFGIGVFTKLIQEHEQAVLRNALRLARRRSDALDLVQDTFERALRLLSNDYPPERIRGWLLVTLRNIYIDRRRALQRAQMLPLLEEIAAPSPELELDTWRTVDDDAIEHSITLLDPRLRDVCELRFARGLSLADIGLELGIPVATAGTRLHRARAQLRRRLMRDASCAPKAEGSH